MGRRDIDESIMGIFSRDVLKEIQSNTPGWEAKLPAQIAGMIKERRLLGYKG